MRTYLSLVLIAYCVSNHQHGICVYDQSTLDILAFHDTLGLLLPPTKKAREIYTAIQSYDAIDYIQRTEDAYTTRLKRMQKATGVGIQINATDKTLLATLIKRFNSAGGRGEDLKKLLQRQLILTDHATSIAAKFGQDQLDAILNSTFTETTKLIISVVQFWRNKLITQKLCDDKTLSTEDREQLEAMQSQLTREFQTKVSQLPGAKSTRIGPPTSIKEFLGTRAYTLRVAYTISVEERKKKMIPLDVFISNITDDGKTLIFLGLGNNNNSLMYLSRATGNVTTRKLPNTHKYVRLNHGRNIAIISKAVTALEPPEFLDINTDTIRSIPKILPTDTIFNVSSDMSAAVIQRRIPGQLLHIFIINTKDGTTIPLEAILGWRSTHVSFYISNNGTYVLVTQPMPSTLSGTYEEAGLIHLFCGTTGKYIRSLANIDTMELSSADISADGNIIGAVVKLGTGHLRHKTLTTWKTDTAQLAQNIEKFKTPYVMLSSDGKFIASIMEHIPEASSRPRRFTFLIITRYGQILTSTASPSEPVTDAWQGVAAMAASQDLRWIAAQMGDGTVTVWHLDEIGGPTCSLSDTLILSTFQALFIPQSTQPVYLTASQKAILEQIKEHGCIIPEDWDKRIVAQLTK